MKYLILLEFIKDKRPLKFQIYNKYYDINIPQVTYFAFGKEKIGSISNWSGKVLCENSGLHVAKFSIKIQDLWTSHTMINCVYVNRYVHDVYLSCCVLNFIFLLYTYTYS